MIKHQFKIVLNAARNKVWNSLWQIDNYRNWTSAFTEGSDVKTDWQEGSEIIFHNGKGNGMYSIIEKMKEPSIMTFKHLGEIKNNERQKEGSWSGAKESYILSEEGDKTQLIIEMDMDEEWKDYFLKTWPVALEKIKTIAESN